MLRVAIIGAGGVALFFAGKKAFNHVRPSSQKKKGGSSPMDIVASGAGCLQSNIGPIEPQDLAIGLAAMSKMTEMEPPGPIGDAADDVGADSQFLVEAQHWRAHIEATYCSDPASWSLITHLPENSIVASCFCPNPDTLRPAYVVCMDPPYGAAVIAIRGTNDVTDMLLNSATHPEEFNGGQVHAGFKHAAESLIEEVEPHVGTAMAALKGTENPRLVLVGHSMGYAVAVLTGLMLQSKFPNISVWGCGPPACTDLNLARKSAEICTAFFVGHDLIPRFSLATVEKLRRRVLSFDWEAADKKAKDDPDWENIKKASATLRDLGGFTDGIVGKFQEAGQAAQKTGDQAKEAVTSNVGKLSPFGGGEEKPQNGAQADKGQGEGQQEQSDSQPLMLYPPGRLFLLHVDPPGCGKMPEQRGSAPQQRQLGCYPTFEESKQATWSLFSVDQEHLDDIVVSPWCISDHMPSMVNLGLDALQQRAKPVLAA